MASSLVSRNIVVAGRRTSMRLEPEMWRALAEIGDAEGLSLNDLCSKIAETRGRSGLTSAVRVFALAYFRAKAVHAPASAPSAETPAATGSGLRPTGLQESLARSGTRRGAR